MKLIYGVAIAALLIPQIAFTQLKDRIDKISYSLGVSISKNLKRQNFDIHVDALIKGFKDAESNSKFLMTEQEMEETLVAFQKETMTKASEKSKKLAEENKKKGEAFLASNKAKDSVVTLTDGLQYKILHEGTGKMPTLEDTVTVNYRGYLIDGTEFDNSYKRGSPATFPLGGVIQGWQEALQLMKTGAKWQIFIPSNLGYGEKGSGAGIPPNAVLIFDVELISFKQ
ncbi:MAG: FKBP-type peptidyl-prolyl cis-trans isomerase [Bacteroidota bacterium]